MALGSHVAVSDEKELAFINDDKLTNCIGLQSAICTKAAPTDAQVMHSSFTIPRWANRIAVPSIWCIRYAINWKSAQSWFGWWLFTSSKNWAHMYELIVNTLVANIEQAGYRLCITLVSRKQLRRANVYERSNLTTLEQYQQYVSTFNYQTQLAPHSTCFHLWMIYPTSSRQYKRKLKYSLNPSSN